MDLFKTWHVLRCCKTLPDAQIPDLFRSVDLNFQTSTFNWSKVNKRQFPYDIIFFSGGVSSDKDATPSLETIEVFQVPLG